MAEVPDRDASEHLVMSVQSDWDDFLFSANKEVWISSKLRGKETIHSRLKSNGLNLPECLSGEFTVLALAPTSLQIRFNPTEHTVHFLAPVRTFTTMRGKRILSLDVTNEGLGVSVFAEDKLALWNAKTGEIRQTLTGHLADIYKCKFFPSGLVVLSGGGDMQMKIWSAETGDCPVTLTGHSGAVNDFCFVDRGRNIISVSQDGTCRLWDCGTSSCLSVIFKTNNKLNCCAIGSLEKSENPIRNKPISDREVGTDNKLLLIGSEEGFVYGVDVLNRKEKFIINVSSSVNVVLLLSSAMIVIGCQNGAIKIYQLRDTKTPHKVIHESSSPILCGCAYSETGFFIGRNDGSVTYYDCLCNSKRIISLTGSDCDAIYDLSCIGNNALYTCCRDGNIRQYAIGEAISEFYKK